MSSVLIAVGIVLLVGVAGFVGLYFFAVRSRRDDEASTLQQALTEPIAREPALAGAGVLPVATASWTGRFRPITSRRSRQLKIRSTSRYPRARFETPPCARWSARRRASAAPCA